MKLMQTVVAVVTLASSASAATWDLSSDFDVASNPTTEWQYGFATSLAGAFSLYTGQDSYAPAPNVTGWNRGSLVFPDNYPRILRNNAATTFDDGEVRFLPGAVIFGPGELGEYSIARWVNPVDADYSLDVTFSPAHYAGAASPSSDVHVLHNGTLLFSGTINEIGTATEVFSDVVALAAGDTLDFAVGFGGNNFFGDFVSADATIETVPEPATPIGGLMLLAMVYARKRIPT